MEDVREIIRIARGDIASWDRSDAWLGTVAEQLVDTAPECEGEPAVGMWAMREGGAIIGTVCVRRRRRTGRLELCRLHIRPDRRGKGLSKRLVFRAVSHAHGGSNERVTAQVAEDNLPSFRALAGFGFREVSRHVRDDGTAVLQLEEETRLRTHDVRLVDGDLTLRPMTEDDWALLDRWNTDPEVLYFAEGGHCTSRLLVETQAIYRSVSQHAFVFVIEWQGRPIGDCWLQRMNLRRVLDRYPDGADLRRIDLVIGEKDCWGRGLGTRVIAMLVRFGFESCGADAIFGCDVADYNPRSRRAFEKNGFVVYQVVPQEPGAKARQVVDLVLARPHYGGGLST